MEHVRDSSLRDIGACGLVWEGVVRGARGSLSRLGGSLLSSRLELGSAASVHVVLCGEGAVRGCSWIAAHARRSLPPSQRTARRIPGTGYDGRLRTSDPCRNATARHLARARLSSAVHENGSVREHTRADVWLATATCTRGLGPGLVPGLRLAMAIRARGLGPGLVPGVRLVTATRVRWFAELVAGSPSGRQLTPGGCSNGSRTQQPARSPSPYGWPVPVTGRSSDPSPSPPAPVLPG
ncbi:hypothetical protein SAMN05421854_11462 [Amycolatopsis rubida]|uniref:Uncharacterized protein n=1 Tax=Amycolatopsis rubida TaxID=112413 RepID=A0A1I5Z7X6_9PSEU|nr:hypothetical protein SAMN05421854_11462 [Amycolatopsis rubida]